MRRPATAAALSVLLSLLVGLGFALAPGAHASGWTESSYTSRLISLVNQARGQHGLRALTVADGTTQVSSSWTDHMASTKTLAHNPDLQHQLETHGSSDWTTYGENVGDGPSDNPDALFQAYMNSSEHRSNILNSSYRFVGVATVFTGDTAWNTFDFVDTYHSSTSRTTVKPVSKPTRPKPVHTTTAPHVTAARATVAAPASKSPVTAAPRHVASAHSHRPRHRHHTDVQGRNVDRHPLAEASVAMGAATPVVALPALALPGRLGLPAELAVCLAAGLVGFVGVRWAQVAMPRRRVAQPA